ncbi:MAG TPA: glycosyltransferase family 39 protein [Vicinamibacterales bacterium]
MRVPANMTDRPTEFHDSVSARPPLWMAGLLLTLVLVSFVVRLPGMVEPLGPDQGVYATMGWGLQRGLALYRDLWEQKPPAIYLTYRVALDVFGDRMSAVFWIDFLASALTVAVMFDIGRRLAGLRFGSLVALAVALGTLPGARYTLGGFLERGVTETFVIPLAALAMWTAVFAMTRSRDGWLFVGGLCVGAAATYKQTALIYWPALVVWVWWVADFRRARRAALYSGLGVIVVPALAFAWLWQRGVLEDAWIALVRYNVAYLAVGGHGFGYTLDRVAHETWRRVKTDEAWAAGSIAAVAAAVFVGRRRTGQAMWVPALGLVWLIAAAVALVANGPRVFATYFMPPLIPMCLMFAWAIDETLLASGRARRIAGAGLLVFTAIMLARSGGLFRLFDATCWDTAVVVGHIDRSTYLERYQSRSAGAYSAADNERLADYLRERTPQGEPIYVFGMSAGTYFLSGHPPAVKFLWAYPPVSNMIDRPDFHVETLAANLARVAPRYIVLQRHNGDSFTGWRAEQAFHAPPLVAVLRNYYQETEIGDFVLYRRQS